MGGAVSSGRDNNELVDNLMGSNYIRSRIVERVFRVLDRADYMTPETRDQAYRDLAWRNGPLHLSAPCIYSEVMEGLELRPGISFLNIGSGTGYLSTLAGLIIGSGGISHGIEVHPMVVEYATKKISQFIENSPTLDEFDFCEPKFFCGNGLCLAPLQAAYDRVYCGAGCPDEYNNYMKQLIKVGGVLVMPLNDNLIQMRRESETEWSSRNLHHVSFATLRVPTKEESGNLLKLDELTPPRLQILARGVVRTCMRKSLQWRHPELREPPPRQQTARPACPRRICIPIEDDSDVEGLNALHDLDRASGANEMNALLSLVLSMGHNRVAGALRFDSMDSHSDSSSDDDDDGDGDDAPGDDDGSGGGGGADGSGSDGGGGGDGDGGGGRGGGGRGGGGGGPTHRTAPTPRTDTNELSTRTCRGVLTLEFQDAPQPIINVSRQPPDIVINNTDNATVITAGFPKANSSSKTDGTNSKTETDNSKTENGSTSSTDNAIVDSDSADTATETMPPGNDNPKPKGRKSKITLKKSRAETKITKTETDGSKTENRDGNKTENGETKKKPNEPKRKMPAEVEIYLAGKDGVGTSYRTEMDWEDTVEIEIETSGEESTENSKELNQQKMDSGIGEETSPTTTNGSSPEKTEANEDSEMDGPSDSVSDNVDAGIEVRGFADRRRQQKRAHGQLGTRSSSSTEAEESGGEGGAGGGATSTRRRFKRRATPSVHGPSPSSTVQGPDARRVRLSIMMKRGVKELPLPYALKKYVNLGRCFQF